MIVKNGVFNKVIIPFLVSIETYQLRYIVSDLRL